MFASSRSAPTTHARHDRRLATLPLVLLVAGLAIALTGVGAVRPAPALALSTFATKCDGVALRARPYTTATNLATLSKGIRVVAVDKVSGGSWRTTCAGTTATGNSWYKITVANGKDVRSRFGLSYVYGASSLFAKLYSMSYKETACDGVNVRTRASTDGTKKATLSSGTKVTVIGTVSGGSWSTTCSGIGVSGSSWYKINQVNGKSTSSLYGVAAVYAAKGLFTSLSSNAPAGNPTPAPGTKSVRVTSIRGLLTTLADNTVGQIVVANGRYTVPSRQLLIDARFANRTKPVLVRAETIGGVTFSGGGATGWLGLHFTQGAHDQTWQGFHFANAEPTQTGVIVFGQSGSVTPVPPHHITLRDITIDATITSNNPYGMSGDHAVYFSSTTSPTHDIVIDRLTVKAATSGLDSALHFYTQPALGPGPRNVTVSHMSVTGTDQAVMFWDASLKSITIANSTITGAKVSAVRYERGGTVTLSGVTSTGSGQHGFYSSMGSNPPGVTFSNASLR